MLIVRVIRNRTFDVRAARFRRLARDYERLAETLAALHYLAFAMLMLANLTRTLTQG